jgi:hypothetical protein
MTLRRNTVLAGTAIAVALIISLSPLIHWLPWVEVVLIVVIGGGGLLVAARRPDGPAIPLSAPSQVPPDPPPVQYQRELVADVRLPSNRADYSFRFAATVVWMPIGAADGNVAGLNGLAINDIVRRASELTQLEDPADYSQTTYKLSRILSELRRDATGRVQAMADSVQLALPEPDQRRLDKLATIRKEEEVWEYERRHEQSRRNYLSTDVLKDPGSAVVWWLARNDDQLEKAVANIDLFTQLSHAVNDTGVRQNGEEPEVPRPRPSEDGTNANQQPASSAAQYFEDFIGSLGIPPDTDAHILLTDQVARLVAMRGHQSVADEMTRKRDVSDAQSDLSIESDLRWQEEDEPPEVRD